MSQARLIEKGDNVPRVKVKVGGAAPQWYKVNELAARGVAPEQVRLIVAPTQALEAWRALLAAAPVQEPQARKKARKAPKPTLELPWKKPVRRGRR